MFELGELHLITRVLVVASRSRPNVD